MGFLDELVSTTKNVAATAGKKTDEAVKLSKLKIKKAQTKSDIKGKYEKLGELVYMMNKDNQKDEDAYNAAIADIDELVAKLDEIDKQLDIGHLRIENVGRDESLGDVETLRICEDTSVGTLALEHISHINRTGKPVSVITNEGRIGKLYMLDVDGGSDEVLNNKGTVGSTVQLG